MADPFDAALADLKRFIAVDIDGDGRPDAMVPSSAGQMPERAMRRMTRQQMYAVEPAPLTPEQERAIAAHRAWQETIGEPTARQLVSEATGIPAAVRAGQNFLTDPSLANATDLGVRSALVAMRPIAAAKVLAAGTGLAAAGDLGLNPLSRATAQSNSSPSADGLTDAQRARLNELNNKISRGAWRSGAERRAIEDEAKSLRDISARFQSDANAARIAAEQQAAAGNRAEYDRAVARAEAARDEELQRDKRFSDSSVGQIWEKTGVLTPFLGAVGLGALARAAHGGKAVGPLETAIAGAGGGAVMANYPLIHNALFTEPDNPQRRAYEAYARELPETHPRKAEWAAYARGLPETNPVRTIARDDLYDLKKLAERSGIGALEGAAGYFTGGHVTQLPNALLQGLGAVPGAVRTGYHRSNAAANAARAEAQAATVPALDQAPASRNARRPTAAPPPPAGPGAGAAAGPAPQLTDIPIRQPGTPPLPAPAGDMTTPVSRPRSAYGAPEQAVARPFIADEVAAGKPFPTPAAVEDRLTEAGLRSPLSRDARKKIETAGRLVAELRAAGLPDAQVAQILRNMFGSKGFPAVAGAIGLGALATADEVPPTNALYAPAY